MTVTRLARSIVMVSLVTAISWIVQATDSAAAVHLRLVRSAPAADSSVSSPTAIRLWFSEQPQLKLSAISLTGPGSAVVKLGDAKAEGPDPLLLVADVPSPLAAGVYKVQWRTASRDGHPIRGEYTFRVSP